MSEHDGIWELVQAGFKQARLDLINLRMENRELRADKDSALNIATQALARAEKAEAAIDRVRALCGREGLDPTDGTLDAWAVSVLRALDGAE